MKNLIAYIRTHTFSKIILTFISILTASLVLVGTFSYYAYRSSLLDNAVESGQLSVDFIMEQVDSEVRNLHYATLSILSNTTLKSFDSYSKEPMPDSQFKLKDMMKEISYLENSYPSIESIWLYANGSGLFITRYGCFTKEEFFEKRLTVRQISGRPLKQALDQASPFCYIGASDVESYYGTSNCLSFLRSVTGYKNEPTGQIIMNIDSGAFTSVLDKASVRSDLTVLLLDGEGGLISASQNAEALLAGDGDIVGKIAGIGDGPEKIILDGMEYTGWATKSAESGLSYVALINRKLLLQSVNVIRLLTIGLMVLCLLVSTVLAFSLTNRLFAPIRKIVRYIQSEGGGQEQGYRDVLLIEQFIDYMKSQNQQLQEHIDSYAAIMQDSLLTELLYAREQRPALERYQKADVSLSFPYECFTVAIIPLRQPDGKTLSGDQLLGAVRALQKEPAFVQQAEVRSLMQNERLVLILNTKSLPGKDLVREMFDSLKRQFVKEGNAFLYAYGKTYPVLTGLYDSFHQAINILMVKPAVVQSEKEAYEEAINARYITSFYPQEMELKLMRQIKSRSSGDAPKTILQEIIDKNKGDGVSVLRLESLFVQLIMTINRVVAEMGLDGAAIFGRDLNHYRALDRYPTLEEKEQYILGSFDKLIDYIRSAKTGKTSEIYQSMLDYVAEHYTEDLSLNDISYQLSLSPSYLSSVFKECHHSTFLDYVNKYRVERAKPLLQQSADTVSVIAQKVGYTNVNTFIRIFKKEEGVTPGQYRTLTGSR